MDVSARTTWHWRTRILIRVTGGYVGKIQVGPCMFARALRRRLRVLGAFFDMCCSKLWLIAGFYAPCILLSIAWFHTLFIPCSRQRAAAYPPSTLPPPTLHSPLPFVQSAAAARIVGQPDIIEAARSGNIGIVRDHLIVDPLSLQRQSVSL